MPELPEVQTVVLGLAEVLVGHRILSIQTDWPKSLRIDDLQIKNHVLQAEIKAVKRIGKMIVIDLSSRFSLLFHLKMTGQLVYRGQQNFGGGHPSQSLIAELPDKTTRIIFKLDQSSHLFFNDMRKFGWLKLCPTTDLNKNFTISQLGPDALSISCEEFVNRFAERRKSVKACLLDQSILAGCGNIYADESLWLSRIHPKTPACRLPTAKLRALHRHLLAVLNLSIREGGSSSRNYVNAAGQKGNYLTFAKVYQKTDFPCSRCKLKIKRIVVAGRGTHFCAKCQQLL